MDFEINRHFAQYADHFFYDQIKYSKLKSDALAFSSKLGEDDMYAFKVKSPYLLMVGILAAVHTHKTAVLISALETDESVDQLAKQVPFKKILDDSHFENLVFAEGDIAEFNSTKPTVVVFSSGTTSAPKGVALSFNNLFYSARGFIEFFNQRDNETSLINLPHHHVGGLMILWRSFFSGGQVVSDPEGKIDFLSLVPTQLKRMIESSTKLSLLKKVRILLIGGAPLSEALKKEAMKHALPVYETYGMSESASLVTINGEVLPYRKLRLEAESGFFEISGETLAVGLYQNQNFTPILPWYKTRDLGFQEPNGRFLFLKRADLIFISGGENINPLQVEASLKELHGIIEACLVPLPDEVWGEIGVMLYQGEVTQKEVRDFLQTKLHPYHVPKYIFKTQLITPGELKPKRHVLNLLAQSLYLNSIFSHEFIKCPVNSKAPVMVFLHGFMGEKNDLLPMAKKFLGQYSLLLIDLAGHGKTNSAHFRSSSDLLSKLAVFIKLTSPDYSLYGYSMGGRVALELTIHYLDPHELILESAGLGLQTTAEKNERLMADQKLLTGIEQTGKAEFFKQWYSVAMFAPYLKHPDFQKDIENKITHDHHEWQASQSLLSAGLFSLKNDVLKKLQAKSKTTKIFYLYGELDFKYKALASELSKLDKHNVEIREIKHAGHNPHKTHLIETFNSLTVLLK